ncbi:MAG: hypothetical protein NZ959_09380, partial [Armatimonadetes bacterium]|nr:hypothetical protein [Armatimonadota bacterium]MDW8122165.1 hypothetical protein [Armatimonadota bacterium]
MVKGYRPAKRFPQCLIGGSLLLFSLLINGCGGLKLPGGLPVPILRVQGEVVEPLLDEDRPVAGARIVINGSDPAVTDSSGRFLLSVPVPSPDVTNLRVFLSFSKHGYLSQVEQVEISGPGTYNLPRPIFVSAAPGSSSLEGRVVDKMTGRGLPDAEVVLILQAGVSLSNRTARDGSFLLSGIPAGDAGIEVPLRARAAEYLVIVNPETGETEKPVFIRRGTEKDNDPVLLELLPIGFPATIRGTVVNAENLLPVFQASVRIADRSGTTDRFGTFRIQGCPTGTQNLRVDHPDFEPYIETVLIDGSPMTIFLNSPASFPPIPYTIAGKVVLEGETNHSGV